MVFRAEQRFSWGGEAVMDFLSHMREKVSFTDFIDARKILYQMGRGGGANIRV